LPEWKNQRDSVDRVAAVCYRYVEGSVQFILVRARSGGWTFPKGHVEEGETNWAAAQREAAEEACVCGPIESEPFAIFPREQRSSDGRRMELLVAAYLLHVESDCDSPEHGREPTWFTPEEAKQRLAEKRDPRHQKAYADVIDKACKKLGCTGAQG
jgi:8-oxo-dGTP pyrophosphatase MutT (NUDIX family)